MNKYLKTAVAFGDLKNAALYFDHLVPVNLGAELMVGGAQWEIFQARGARELLPPDLAENERFGRGLVKLNEKTFNVVAKEGIRRFGLEPRISRLSPSEYEQVEGVAAQAYFDFVEEFGLSEWPLAGKGTPSNATFEAGVEGCPLLTLSRVSVIDASEASWEQIFEFRQDTVAREKLRRLRLFAFKNYSDKPLSFIEDDLLNRISEYREVATQWGLETFQGTLGLVLNSKLAAGAFVSFFLSTLFGQPVTAALAAGIGAAAEIGNFGLELRRRNLALRALTRENPVSYIIYAEEQLGVGDAR